MDKYIGLRFNLKNGSFFQIKIEKAEAESVLLKFRSGQAGQDHVVGGCDPDNTIWAIKLADVSFIHSFNWQEYEMQMRMQQLQAPRPGDAVNDPIHNCGSIQAPWKGLQKR